MVIIVIFTLDDRITLRQYVKVSCGNLETGLNQSCNFALQLKKEKLKAKKGNRRNKNRNKNFGSGGKDEDEKTDQQVLGDQDKPVNPDGDQIENTSNPSDSVDLKQDQVPNDVETNGLEQAEPEVPIQSEGDSTTTDTIKNENVINDPTYFENVSKIDNVKVTKLKPDEKIANSDGDEIKIKNETNENGLSLPPAKKKPANPKRKPANPKQRPVNPKKNGSEEEDEDDGFSEEADEDWEWDYGEQWNENNDPKPNEENEKDAKDDQDSDYLEVNDIEDSKNDKEVIQ